MKVRARRQSRRRVPDLLGRSRSPCARWRCTPSGIRIMFTMARDGRLPLGSGRGRVSGKSKTPIIPALVIGLLTIVLLVINIGNQQVFLVLTSVAIILFYVAYMCVTYPMLLRRLQGRVAAARQHGPVLLARQGPGWPSTPSRWSTRRRGRDQPGLPRGQSSTARIALVFPVRRVRVRRRRDPDRRSVLRLHFAARPAERGAGRAPGAADDGAGSAPTSSARRSAAAAGASSARRSGSATAGSASRRPR